MSNGIVKHAILLIIMFIGFLVNVIPKPEEFIIRKFNLYYMIFIVLAVFAMDLIGILSVIMYIIEHNNAYRFSELLRQLSFEGYNELFVLYIVFKIISSKDTKAYFNEIGIKEEDTDLNEVTI